MGQGIRHEGGNVRVNVIAPGYTMTDILSYRPPGPAGQVRRHDHARAARKAGGDREGGSLPGSDDASYVTGHVLSVNGGMRL
jgi:3-oxoacyl-[acyl-carrier protein] reductase